MLSDDMKKEGLMARTLTLKLKTATFEVGFQMHSSFSSLETHICAESVTICNHQIRSRAVSLQRYTCSSEDILKHATKLLKAELPVSIRLIGARHFNVLCSSFLVFLEWSRQLYYPWY